MLNALSSHSKLNSSSSSSSSLSSQRLSVAATTTTTCSPSSTSGKMNLSANQPLQNPIGHLNLSSSNDSSNGAGGGGGSSPGLITTNNHSHNNNNSSNNNNNNNHHHHHSHSLNSFHFQQYQQQQQLGNNNNQQGGVESIEANKGYTFEEQFKQLYELSDDPKRKEFLDDLFQFMADRNQPVNRIPIMAKQVLDLYELYNLVVARGGLVEVINKKIWREITKGLNLPSSITSAAFTLRTQYMKYLYPYECAKNNFSHQDELQQAIDGNRREGRRAGASSLAGYGPYLGSAGPDGAQIGHYSASPSPNHLFAGTHNLLAQAHQQQHQHQHNHHHQSVNQHNQHQPLQLIQDPRDQQRPQSSGSSNASPNASFNQQRLYQDSIESDHEDEGSIDLGSSSKRNSPIDHEHQHLDPHNHHLNQQQAAAEQQQQQLAAAAAAAAALRQQLGAAINFAGTQSFLGQLSGQTNQAAAAAAAVAAAGNPNVNPNPNQNATTNTTNAASGANQSDLIKQQQEQFLAALMAAANQQQQQPQSQQQQPGATNNPDQQAATRAALSMMASNAMLIAASNAPDAMAVAAAAQAIGVKGAFIILLL